MFTNLNVQWARTSNWIKKINFLSNPDFRCWIRRFELLWSASNLPGVEELERRAGTGEHPVLLHQVGLGKERLEPVSGCPKVFTARAPEETGILGGQSSLEGPDYYGHLHCLVGRKALQVLDAIVGKRYLLRFLVSLQNGKEEPDRLSGDLYGVRHILLSLRRSEDVEQLEEVHLSSEAGVSEEQNQTQVSRLESLVEWLSEDGRVNGL